MQKKKDKRREGSAATDGGPDARGEGAEKKRKIRTFDEPGLSIKNEKRSCRSNWGNLREERVGREKKKKRTCFILLLVSGPVLSESGGGSAASQKKRKGKGSRT